ncbi:MAG: hypothetical protein QXI93_00315 [Candidatus Methanomethylicia archaeon]
MFKFNAKELKEKLEWIMQTLNMLNDKLNDTTTRVMKIEAELEKIQPNEIEESVGKIITSSKKFEELTHEIDKIKELTEKITERDFEKEVLKRITIIDDLNKRMENATQTLIQLKEAIDKNINNIAEKIGNVYAIHQETMKNIINIKDLEINAMKNIATTTSVQKETVETASNLKKLIEEYKGIIDQITSTKMEIKSVIEEIERRDMETKRRMEELLMYEEELQKREKGIEERERMISSIANTLIEKVKEYEEILKNTNLRISYLKILEEKSKDLEKGVMELKNEKDRLEKEVKMLTGRRENLQEEVCRLNEKKSELEKELRNIMVAMKVESRSRINI